MNGRYVTSCLSGEQKQLLLKQIDNLMNNEKVYLNEKLSLDDLARQLNTNSRYISQVINENFNKNFYSFINNYRIKEAQKLLSDMQQLKYSIYGISRMVGFTSK
jgi:YesN/AraC family two-component response regulator